jgi:hypothetical protein
MAVAAVLFYRCAIACARKRNLIMMRTLFAAKLSGLRDHGRVVRKEWTDCRGTDLAEPT